MAGTSFSLGTLEHDLPLLAPMDGGWPLDRNSWTLGSRTKRPTPLCRQHLYKNTPSRPRCPSENLRIKPLDSPKAGTTQSSLRPLRNADTSWLSSSFPGSALRQQQPNNYCHFWQKPWSSSGTRASTPMNSDTLSRTTAAWPAYRLVQIEPATDGAIRSFIASDTWWKTSLSASSIGAAWRPAMRDSHQLSSLSQHLRLQSILSDANKSTRPRHVLQYFENIDASSNIRQDGGFS
jgi:hypothetical protein